MKDNYLRQKVRIIHALQQITYKEIAEYIDIKQGSFLNWLSGCYEFGDARRKQLEEILDILQE